MDESRINVLKEKIRNKDKQVGANEKISKSENELNEIIYKNARTANNHLYGGLRNHFKDLERDIQELKTNQRQIESLLEEIIKNM